MRKVILFISLMGLLLLAGCTQDVTLDVPQYSPRLSAFCMLITDSIPRAYLTFSSPKFDYRPQPNYDLGTAKVVITDVTANTADTLRYDHQEDNFVFSAHRKIIAGHTYRMYAGFRSYQVTAETKVPLAVQIDKLILKTPNQLPADLEMIITDQPGADNAYEPVMAGVIYYDTTQTLIMADTMNIHEEGLFSDKGIDGKQIDMSFSEDYGSGIYPGTGRMDMIYRVYNLTQATADYIQSVKSQPNAAGNPFTEPVFIKSNVTGGLGLLGAMTLSKPYTVRIF